MVILKKFFLLTALLATVSFSAHKFYVSVTQVNYSESDKSLQITTRIFIDDFEDALKKKYGKTLKLATPDELPDSNVFINEYLLQNLAIRINGKSVMPVFLGKEYENDVIKCYLEVEHIQLKKLKSIEIKNRILFESFDDQNNIVHFKINKLRKSFSLYRENDKGLLKL